MNRVYQNRVSAESICRSDGAVFSNGQPIGRKGEDRPEQHAVREPELCAIRKCGNPDPRRRTGQLLHKSHERRCGARDMRKRLERSGYRLRKNKGKGDFISMGETSKQQGWSQICY